MNFRCFSNAHPLNGPVVATFFRFVIPSTLSLLAISTASVVDGIFVGNFIGAEALAAVNLLMPYFSVLFGIALMFAIGGSVKAGIALGKKDDAEASTAYSNAIMAVVAINSVAIPIAWLCREPLFVALGASPELFPMMSDYLAIISFAFLFKLCGLVTYYFVRADDYPELGMQALMIGAVMNIILNYIFIAHLNLGVAGAAWATVCGQIVQLAVLARYFYKPHCHIRFTLQKPHLKTLWQSAYNGFSECINEVSIALVILVFHVLINRQAGVDGIAAFSVINYLIFISLMVYYGIVDAMHGLLSQNVGAGKIARVRHFMFLATASISVLSLAVVAVVLLFDTQLAGFFLDEDTASIQQLTEQYIYAIWPIFLLNGFNVLISAYLTCAEKPLQSSIVALLRSLLLPIGFALAIAALFNAEHILYAIPVAEGATLLVACIFFLKFRPSQLDSRTE